MFKYSLIFLYSTSAGYQTTHDSFASFSKALESLEAHKDDAECIQALIVNTDSNRVLRRWFRSVRES